MQNAVLALDWLQLKLVEQLQRIRVGIGVGHQLHHEFIGADVARVAVGVGGAGFWIDFIFIPISAFPLDMRRTSGQRLEPRNARRITINEIGILRNVIDDLHTGGDQVIVPRGLYRSGEMNEVQPLPGKFSHRLRQRLDFRQAGIQQGGIEVNQMIIVPQFNARIRNQRDIELRHRKQLVTAVISNHRLAPGGEFARQRRVVDLDFMVCVGQIAGGKSPTHARP